MRSLFLSLAGLVLCAAPTFAADEQEPLPMPGAITRADVFVEIASVRVDAAFDEKTTPASKDELLEMARKGYLRALRLEPKHKGAMLGLARYYARTGEQGKAVETYKKYLTLYPRDADIAHEVAIAHTQSKDFAGAVTWCEFALKIDPECRVAKKTLGFCLARTGKWEDAFATLSRIMPEAEARYNMARVMDHMGRAAECDAQLRLALKADPSFTPARDMLTARGERVLAGDTVARELRYIDVEDTARAIKQFLGAKNPNARLTFDARTNTVFFSCQEPEVCEQIMRLLGALDAPPPQVTVRVTVVKVPRGFAKTSGLEIGCEPGCPAVLSPRELHMLMTILQNDSNCEVVATPAICAADGQMVFWGGFGRKEVTTGFDVKPAGGIEAKTELIPFGLWFAVTQKLSTDGTAVELDVGAGHNELFELPAVVMVAVPDALVPVARVVTVPLGAARRVRGKATVPLGHTVVFTMSSGGWSFTSALSRLCGDKFDTLLIVTPVAPSK